MPSQYLRSKVFLACTLCMRVTHQHSAPGQWEKVAWGEGHGPNAGQVGVEYITGKHLSLYYTVAQLPAVLLLFAVKTLRCILKLAKKRLGLHGSVLYSIAMHHITLYWSVSYCIELRCAVLHWIAYQSQARGWNAYPPISWSSCNLPISSSYHHHIINHHFIITPSFS